MMLGSAGFCGRWLRRIDLARPSFCVIASRSTRQPPYRAGRVAHYVDVASEPVRLDVLLKVLTHRLRAGSHPPGSTTAAEPDPSREEGLGRLSEQVKRVARRKRRCC